jgi:glucokinase
MERKEEPTLPLPDPTTVFPLAGRSVTAIGLDMGGTKLAAGLVNNAEVVRRLEEPTPRTLAHLLELIETMVTSLRESPSDPVGLGVPGPVVNGESTFFSNLPEFNSVRLGDVISARLGVPVALENDANLAALAESRFGSGRHTRNSVYLTWSTGIGCGLILNGQIHPGRIGMAGEVGHTRMSFSGTMDGSGTLGTLEAQASGAALARDAAFVFGSPMTAREIVGKATTGNPVALALLRNAASHLGLFLHNMQLLLDPDVIILGGGLSMSADLLLPLVEEERRKTGALHDFTKICLATLGKNAGIIGAAELARDRSAELR